MFCEKCGEKLQKSDKFCSACGYKNITENEKNILDQKWWLRLIKVLYIILWVPLPIIVVATWSINEPYYEEAFGYSLLAGFIYFSLIKSIKIAFLYIALGEKPNWKQEFKKLF